MTKHDKKVLIRLICQEQTKMLLHDATSYESKTYRSLERLKVQIKDDPEWKRKGGEYVLN